MPLGVLPFNKNFSEVSTEADAVPTAGNPLSRPIRAPKPAAVREEPVVSQELSEPTEWR